MKQLKTALVGLGRIGWQFHLPHIAAHEGFDLTAVVDPLQERRDEAVQQYSVRSYADTDELLAAEKPDLIVLASPTHLHADQAVAAMQRGIDVFCDKPLAISLEEADRIIAAMERYGRKLMVYQPHRITPEVQAVRHIIDAGILGDLFLIKRTVARYNRRNDWQALKRFGGGMLSNYGAHFIDQLLYLTNARPIRAACALRAIATLGDSDDVVKALLEMDNGIILDVEINMAAALPAPGWVLMGKHGTAAIKEDGSAFNIHYHLPEKLPPLEINPGLAANGRMYSSGETIEWLTKTVPLSDFPPINYYDLCYAYYGRGEEPFVPVSQTRETMRTLAACREDAERQK